jgi:signal-transduction protein with cAMP-binding, CBS, and nucleotidyltransferase domain
MKMGFFSTIASFGIGYAAGAVAGRQGVEQLSARARQIFSQQRGSGGKSSPVDVREIRQVMTAAPDAVRTTDTLQEATRLMKTKDIGDVLVEDAQGLLAGIITDRDVAIRATAEGADPKTTKVEGIYTHDVTALAPTDTVHDAMQLMRARNVRRLPVVERGRAIGIVSLGDISVETTPSSVLADISTASPDR